MADANATSSGIPRSGLATTSAEFNWRVVVYMYVVGLALCAIFGAIHYLEAFEPLNGAWLIFTPFCPSLLFALRRDWLQRQSSAGTEKQKDE